MMVDKICSHFSMTSKYYTVTQVKIGLQRTFYAVTEDQIIVLVCTGVEAGSTAGRTIIIDYQTTDGSAKGIKFNNQRSS